MSLQKQTILIYESCVFPIGNQTFDYSVEWICVGGLCYKSVYQPYIDLREKCASQIVYESHLSIIS